MKKILPTITILLAFAIQGCSTFEELQDSGVLKDTLVKIIETGTTVLVSRIASFESTEISQSELQAAIDYYQQALDHGVSDPAKIMRRYGRGNELIQNANEEYINYLITNNEGPSLTHIQSIIQGLKNAGS